MANRLLVFDCTNCRYVLMLIAISPCRHLNRKHRSSLTKPDIHWAFETIFKMWFLEVILVVNVTPKSIMESTLVSGWPSTWYSHFIWQCALEIDITLHFFTLKYIFQRFAQISNDFRSFCNTSESEVDFIFLNILTSSANDDTVEEHLSDISFTYSINRSGPKIEPCGTPDVTGKFSDCLPSTIKVWLHSDR